MEKVNRHRHLFLNRKLLEQLNSTTNVSEEDYEKLKQEVVQVS